MITIDRLSLPTTYEPKVGDILEITEITGSNGRWRFGMRQADRKAMELPKDVMGWLLKRLSNRDAAEFMLWYTVGKPLGEGQPTSMSKLITALQEESEGGEQ